MERQHCMPCWSSAMADVQSPNCRSRRAPVARMKSSRLHIIHSRLYKSWTRESREWVRRESRHRSRSNRLTTNSPTPEMQPVAPRVTGSTPSLTPTFSFLYSRYHSKCTTLSYSGLAQPLAFNDPTLPAAFTSPAGSRSRPHTTCVARSTTISCTSLMTRKEH